PANQFFVQRRPFFIQSLFLDLPQLHVGDLEVVDNGLPRFGHGQRPLVLGLDEGRENLPPLLQSQALGTHHNSPPTSTRDDNTIAPTHEGASAPRDRTPESGPGV